MSTTQKMVVDVLELRAEQRVFLQREIKRLLEAELASGRPGLLNEPIVFLE